MPRGVGKIMKGITGGFRAGSGRTTENHIWHQYTGDSSLVAVLEMGRGMSGAAHLVRTADSVSLLFDFKNVRQRKKKARRSRQ